MSVSLSVLSVCPSVCLSVWSVLKCSLFFISEVYLMILAMFKTRMYEYFMKLVGSEQIRSWIMKIPFISIIAPPSFINCTKYSKYISHIFQLLNMVMELVMIKLQTMISPTTSLWMMIKQPLPSGKHTTSYWKLPFIVDLPIKNSDFPWFTPENGDFPSFFGKVYQRVSTTGKPRPHKTLAPLLPASRSGSQGGGQPQGTLLAATRQPSSVGHGGFHWNMMGKCRGNH